MKGATHQDQTGNLYVRKSPAATNSSTRGISARRREVCRDRGRTGRYAAMFLEFALLEDLDGGQRLHVAREARGIVAHRTEVLADRPVLLLIGGVSTTVDESETMEVRTCIVCMACCVVRGVVGRGGGRTREAL